MNLNSTQTTNATITGSACAGSCQLGDSRRCWTPSRISFTEMDGLHPYSFLVGFNILKHTVPEG